MNGAAAIVAVVIGLFVALIVSLILSESACPRCGHPMSGHVRWLVLPGRCRTRGRWCGMI
jgi:hypothetical protein